METKYIFTVVPVGLVPVEKSEQRPSTFILQTDQETMNRPLSLWPRHARPADFYQVTNLLRLKYCANYKSFNHNSLHLDVSHALLFYKHKVVLVLFPIQRRVMC